MENHNFGQRRRLLKAVESNENLVKWSNIKATVGNSNPFTASMMNNGLYVAAFMLAMMFIYHTFKKVHRKEDDYAEYKDEGEFDEEAKSTELQSNTNAAISSNGFGSTTGASVEEVRV